MFRSTTRKIVLFAAAFALAGGGAFTAVTFTSSSVGASAGPPPLDHFTCYQTSVIKNSALPGFLAPPGTRFINQFAPNGFVPKVGKPVLHCNPTLKVVPTGAFPPVNPLSHLLCFKVTGPAPAFTNVHVANQFSPLDASGAPIPIPMIVGLPKLVCLPTWKSLSGPPNMPTPQPPNLDHFTCYGVKVAPGARFVPPTAIQLQDQFSPGALVGVKVGKPKLLCAPTTKILPTGQVFPTLGPNDLHLLCYAVSPTPIISPIFDQNQFGQGELAVKKTKLLCLPSVKTVP
ncbi:MAG TPA: hypothetical protein VK277_02960 [Acidimicrobiales bacterium]|nr:hypothetical protein [Acidimicrobiales bacterium]